VNFYSVWSGSGPICKYFLEAKGPTVNFTNARGPWHNLQQVQGLSVRFTRFIEFMNFSPTEKPVDWVHGAVDRWHTSGSRWTEGSVDTRHDSVLPARSAAGLRSSTAKAREEEGDETVSVRGSDGGK
jgi:hypothetical protein